MAIIGIDLGTTNSLACVYRETSPELIPIEYGSFLTPSAVAIDNGVDSVCGYYWCQRIAYKAMACIY